MVSWLEGGPWSLLRCLGLVEIGVLWKVLMLVDSEVAVRVSGAAETVDYFG